MTVHDFLDSLDPADRGIDMVPVADQLGAARADLDATMILLDAAGAGRLGQPLAVRVAALISDRDTAQGVARAVQGSLETYATLRDVADQLRGQSAKLPPGPVGAGDAINALAATVHESPAGTAHVIERLPGLAHAIDRVTRFADPPVDVYAHRTAGPSTPAAEPGGWRTYPSRSVVCLVCRATVMTLPNGTLPVHDQWGDGRSGDGRPGRALGQCAGTGTTDYTLPTPTAG